MSLQADFSHLTTTKGLIESGGATGAYKDRLFTMMSHNWTPAGLELHYDAATPAVALNNDIVAKLEAETGVRVPSVPELRGGVIKTPEWLISGGTLLSDDAGRLIVFRRTRTGPNGKLIAWPEALNNPMGRVGEKPSVTLLKEGAEEIFISELVPGDGELGRDTLLPRMFNYLGQKGISEAQDSRLVAELATYLGSKNMETYPISQDGHGPSIEATLDARYASQLKNVSVFCGSVLVDEFQAVVAQSHGDRTFEMAVPLRLADSEYGYSRHYFAREPFGRQVSLLSDPEVLEAEHYAWALGLRGVEHDPEQKKDTHIGGILPILQAAVGLDVAADPKAVTVPAAWSKARIQKVLGL